MKIVRFFSFSAVAALTLAVALVSCDKSSRDESRHPLYVKAGKCKEKNRYDEAAKLYERYLEINPDSTKTHRELAGLYHDNLNDPMLAIYHYRRCLAANPVGEDAEQIRLWMEASEREYFNRLEKSYGDRTELNKLTTQYKKIASQNNKLKRYLILLRKQNKQLERELASKNPGEKTSPRSLPKPLKTPPIDTPKTMANEEPKGTLAKESVSTEPAVPEAGAGHRFYVVEQGDTLVGISKKMYGQSKYYELIYQANKHILHSRSKLSLGQRLVIPNLPAEQP